MIKTFIVTIKGDINAGKLEDVIWHGLERNEIDWKEFDVKEEENND